MYWTVKDKNISAATIGEVSISNFLCIQLNTQPNTQNFGGLELCIPIGLHVKVTLNNLDTFAAKVIKFIGVFQLCTKIYHGKFGVST